MFNSCRNFGNGGSKDWTPALAVYRDAAGAKLMPVFPQKNTLLRAQLPPRGLVEKC